MEATEARRNSTFLRAVFVFKFDTRLFKVHYLTRFGPSLRRRSNDFFKGQKWKRLVREKHRMAKGKIVTSRKQREGLAAIKSELAHMGYQIFPVATQFRRTRHDFLAVPREYPNRLLLVRPTRGRANEVRYYAFLGSYAHAQNQLEAHKDTCGKMIWAGQLPSKDKSNDWRLYISRNCQLELSLFTNNTGER